MDKHSFLYNAKAGTTIGEVLPFETEAYRKESIPGGESLTGHKDFPGSLTSHSQIRLDEPMKGSPLTLDPLFFKDPVEVSSGGPFSETIKIITRELTKRISQEDEKHLIAEHAELVKKKFKNGLSNDEQRQLDFIRWQLDRIDDARHGEDLDHLAEIIESHEQFAQELEKVLSKIGIESPKR